jgi:hypothetical protein
MKQDNIGYTKSKLLWSKLMKLNNVESERSDVLLNRTWQNIIGNSSKLKPSLLSIYRFDDEIDFIADTTVSTHWFSDCLIPLFTR